MAAIYDNQKNGAMKIIEEFESCNWVIASAQMQSGKSNTYMMVGAELLRTGRVSNVVVISANTDIELKNQTKDTTLFWRAYRKYLRSNNILDADEAEELTACMENQISVIWGTELNKHTEQLVDALIIWDESHYGQSNNQMIDHWLCVQGISPDGSGSANGNIVLSVSATPFSECIDIEKYVQVKGLVRLEPGNHYFGVKNMMENGAIKPFDREELPTMLDKLVGRADGRNAAIIRVSSKSVGLERSIKFLSHQRGIRCVDMNATSDEKDINVLLKDNNEPLVVLIKGMLRMGKRIEHKHRLRWCLETTTDPNHDTTLQGLLGRCCGYPESGSGPEIEVYLSPKQVENLMEWGVDRAGKAMNVKKVGHSRRKPEITGYPTPPLKVFLPPRPAGTPNISSIQDLANALIEDRGTDPTADCASEILTSSLSSGLATKIDFNNLERGTYKKHNHADLLERCHAIQKPLVSTKTACGCKLDQVRVWYTGDNVHGKYVYLQYKTDIKPETDDSPMTVGNTTGREIFAHKHEDGSKSQQNGSAHFKLSPETAHDVEAMKEGVEVPLVWGRELRAEHVTPPTEITSDCNGYSFTGILVSPEVHAALKPSGVIYEHMKTNHDVLLKLVASKGRPPKELPAGYSRLAAIKWV